MKYRSSECHMIAFPPTAGQLQGIGNKSLPVTVRYILLIKLKELTTNIIKQTTMKKKRGNIKTYLLVLFVLFLSCKEKNDAPLINNQTFTIEENSTEGTQVGQIIALDPENDAFTFGIIDGNTNGAFTISAEYGMITVQNEDAIDFETNPIFTLLIEVKDIGNRSSVATATIKLNNIKITENGLILYMPFNGNLNDLSQSQNNGINYTSDNYVSGIKSEALDFNGTTDYIQLSESINSQDGLSFSFWIKTRGANEIENNGAIVSKYSMANNTRSFMIFSFGAYETRNDNRLSAMFYKNGYSSDYYDLVKSYIEPSEIAFYSNPSLWTISNPMRLTKDIWTHCIINVTECSIETWLNGEFCTKKRREYNEYFTSDEPVYIGNNVSSGEGSNNHFNGILDELRIYNRGLTNDEIKALFKE